MNKLKEHKLTAGSASASLEFRPADRGDEAAIAKLVTELLGTCEFDPADQTPKTYDEIFERNAKHVAENLEHYYVCCVNGGGVVGACGISGVKTGNPYGLSKKIKYREILYLVVDSNFQRQGIGTQLLRMCLENGDAPIVYEAWGSGGSVNSKVLLERFGFVLVKNLGATYYKDHGYCPYCVNRAANCTSCLAEVYIKFK